MMEPCCSPTTGLEEVNDQADDVVNNTSTTAQTFAIECGIVGGTSFPTAAALKRACNVYAKKFNFAVNARVDQRAAESFRARIECVRSGNPQRKKLEDANDSIALRKRKRTSQRCGCGFRIHAIGNSREGPFTITNSHLKHTGGCSPSLVQLQASLRRRGQRIPHDLLSHLVDLIIVIGPNNTQLRRFLQDKNLTGYFDDSSTGLRNLRLRIHRALADIESKSQFDKNKNISDMITAQLIHMQPRNLTSTLSYVETAGIIKYIVKCTGSQTENTIKILENLRSKLPEFDFRITKTSRDHLSAIVWQTRFQRTLAMQYGQVIYFDGTYSTNNSDFVYFAPTIMDEEGKLMPICFGLAYEDKTNCAHQAIMEMMVDLTAGPAFKMIVQTVVTDSGVSERVVKDLFPNADALLCVWHQLQNVRKNLGRFSNFLEMNKSIRTMIEANSIEEFDTIWGDFKIKYALSAVQYFEDQWISCKQRWARPWRLKSLTFGYVANLSESVNSSTKSFIRSLPGEGLPTLSDVITRSILYIASICETSKSKRAILEVEKMGITECTMKSVVEKYYGSKAVNMYAEQEKLVSSYSVEEWNCDETKEFLIRRVNRNESFIDRSKARKVTCDVYAEIRTYRCSCLEDTSTGIPCRHIIAVFFKVQPGKVCLMAHFNSRWEFNKNFQNYGNDPAISKFVTTAIEGNTHVSHDCDSSTAASEQSLASDDIESRDIYTGTTHVQRFNHLKDLLSDSKLKLLANNRTLFTTLAKLLSIVQDDSVSSLPSVERYFKARTSDALVMPKVTQIGRPVTKRKVSATESHSQSAKKGKISHIICSFCKLMGHSRTSCDKFKSLGRVVNPADLDAVFMMPKHVLTTATPAMDVHVIGGLDCPILCKAKCIKIVGIWKWSHLESTQPSLMHVDIYGENTEILQRALIQPKTILSWSSRLISSKRAVFIDSDQVFKFHQSKSDTAALTEEQVEIKQIPVLLAPIKRGGKFSLALTTEVDLHTLIKSRWLNTGAISMFAKHIIACNPFVGRLKNIFMDPSIFQKQYSVNSTSDTKERIMRYLRKAFGGLHGSKETFTLQDLQIFLPVCVRNTHWRLLVVRTDNETVNIYDSLRTKSTRRSNRSRLTECEEGFLQHSPFNRYKVIFAVCQEQTAEMCGYYVLNNIEICTTAPQKDLGSLTALVHVDIDRFARGLIAQMQSFAELQMLRTIRESHGIQDDH